MNDHNILILEACVASLEQALLAKNNGAHRIELCGNLSVGGVTPDRNVIIEVLQKVSLPIKVMIRPRGGDYFYSNQAF